MESKERWDDCLLEATRLEECYMDDPYLLLVPRERERGRREREKERGGK